ncbi:MAG: hypothetical protein KC713_03655 [Candidatus Omnitrophica bacterium]|nr:hypothetical protein [Candidatus Omnitrophota bacterium]
MVVRRLRHHPDRHAGGPLPQRRDPGADTVAAGDLGGEGPLVGAAGRAGGDQGGRLPVAALRADAIHPNYVQMPPFEAFRDAESYYATLAHELTHWTRHPSRLDREFGRKRHGDEGYAKEELVAELGAAFLCADLEITLEARDDHTSYIASWLKVLKDDTRAVFRAASHAQRAVNFLHSLQKAQSEAA